MRRFFDGKVMILTLLRTSAGALLFFLLYSRLDGIFSLPAAAVGLLIAVTAGPVLSSTGLKFPYAIAAAAAGAFLLRGIMFLFFSIIVSAGEIPAADFLFFRFDSGFFPLLLPCLYVFTAGFFAVRKPSFISVEVLLNAVLFAFLLWKEAGFSMSIFPHPGFLAVYSLIFIVLEIFILIIGSREKRTLLPGIGEFIPFLALVIPALLIVLLLLFGSYTENASRDGGGLMKPTLFRFDFSDYVKLETEISMGDDLVLLLRNYGYLNSVYLRRFYLSGYKAERGFYLQAGPGEAEQLINVPDRHLRITDESFPQRISSEQEYFIINLDPSSLVAMNFPVEISPLTNWKDSSFLRNYRVVSETVEMPSWELAEAPAMDMPEKLLKFYTDYGDDELIKELAEEVTEGLPSAYDKVVAIMFYLRDSYYYSLKPGVAADGNQLHHFLFNSRKGYCSYFAFSMALMCRSIGIPARVAAGFFIDPGSGVLNVYPVREDMAHAWVEVAFEDFGWVEFDPTSEQIAPGEDIEFGDLSSTEYSGLIEEIFSNEYGVKSAADEDSPVRDSSAAELIRRAGRLIMEYKRLSVAAGYIIFLLFFHIRLALIRGLSRGSRKVRVLYRECCRKAAAAGYRRRRGESILEFAERTDSALGLGLTEAAECYLESVFSGACEDRLTERTVTAWKVVEKNFRKRSLPGRVLAAVFPFIGLTLRRRGKLPVAALLLPLLLCLCAPGAEAQDTYGAESAPETVAAADAEWYLEAAGRERDSENYEAALKLLNEGIALYPMNWELKSAAGDLYADRELYNLALEQYRQALEISVDNSALLYSLSVTEGLLNLDKESIQSLEKILEIEPDHYDALADLGWMYFKTFRLNEAEQLLKKALDIYEDSPILYMTLGTVYSGKYDYLNAEKYYLKAINLALDKGWDYFASVSYYNLSLLEHGFYEYENALEYTNRSIETAERAPGYIARAEIYLGRMDFNTAFQDYQQAYVMDSTPLALMGLAELYTEFGLLDEALSHIQEVLGHEDSSWMYYFGVDPDRHRMEIDRILRDIYSAMAVRALFKPKPGYRRLGNLFHSLKFRCMEWYHDRRYRRAAYDVGMLNRGQGNRLDAAWSLYLANGKYKLPALKYLSESEEIEMSITSLAEGFYLLEKGKLLKDAGLLSEALGRLDREWERREIAEAMEELIRIYSKTGDRATAARLSTELYRINPGAFVGSGLKFPLYIDFKPGLILNACLRFSGFQIFTDNENNFCGYKLSSADNYDRGMIYSIAEVENGKVLFTIETGQPITTPRNASAFTAELKMRFFNITNGKGSPLYNF